MFLHLLALHSTMFLLIPKGQGWASGKNYFTFHNVSINTTYTVTGLTADSGLYIPQCFY